MDLEPVKFISVVGGMGGMQDGTCARLDYKAYNDWFGLVKRTIVRLFIFYSNVD